MAEILSFPERAGHPGFASLRDEEWQERFDNSIEAQEIPKDIRRLTDTLGKIVKALNDRDVVELERQRAILKMLSEDICGWIDDLPRPW